MPTTNQATADSLSPTEVLAAASTVDLVSLAETRDFLKIRGADKDLELAVLITRASAIIERRTGRPLRARAFVNLRLPWPVTGRLYVPGPIDTHKTISITCDTTAETVWRSELDGDPDDFDWMVAGDDPFDPRRGAKNHLRRLGGSPFRLSYSNPYPIKVSYTGGFDPVPEDLKQACLYFVQKLWRDQDRQATNIVSSSIQSGGSVTMPEAALAIPREVDILIWPYREPILA